MTNGEKFKTTKERANAFEKFCEAQPMGCNECELTNYSGDECRYAWLNLEYKVVLNPCPFCNSEAVLIEDKGVYNVFCTGCAATSNSALKSEVAINLWNRRVK